MASREDLIRIGIEGFVLIEGVIEKKGKNPAPRRPHMQSPSVPEGIKQTNCLHQYQHQQNPLYQVKPVFANEKINMYEVPQFRDGATIMDYTKRDSAPMFY